MEDRLTDEEVARVLRRASELDPATTTPADSGMPGAAVEAAAAEVGLSPAAVRQAVAELRTGALDEPGALVVCARVVPGSSADALVSVGHWLKGQAMVRARDRVTEQVWRPREDVMARIQRRLDFAAAIRLRAADEVVVRAVDVEDGSLVRLTVHLEPPIAGAPRLGAGIGGAGGVLAAVGLAAATGDPGPVLVLGTAPAAGTGGYIGWRIGRRVRERERQRVGEAIDGLLDELELGRVPPGSPVDRLATRARRLRGGWTA